MGDGSEFRPQSLSALSCPPPPPGTHSALCTLCTIAPFPVVLCHVLSYVFHVLQVAISGERESLGFC